MPDFQHNCVAKWLLGNQTSSVDRNKPVDAVDAQPNCVPSPVVQWISGIPAKGNSESPCFYIIPVEMTRAWVKWIHAKVQHLQAKLHLGSKRNGFPASFSEADVPPEGYKCIRNEVRYIVGRVL